MSYGLVYQSSTNRSYDLMAMKPIKLEDICLNKEVYIGVTNGYDHWYCSANVTAISSEEIKLQGIRKMYLVKPNDLGYLAVFCHWDFLPKSKQQKFDWKYGF